MPVNSSEKTVLRASIPVTNYEVHKNSVINAKILYSDQTINLKSKVKNEK
jgi:hypothetical protein